MSEFFAALPMYDWPEVSGETDAQWARLRDGLRREGIDAPEKLARRNVDLPSVSGGIRDASGAPLAPDPATLPPDEFDQHVAWLHPDLLLAQTCWGPMGLGLERHVQVVGQPDYSAFEGGQGALYSSALVMRGHAPVGAPSDGRALLPVELLRGKRLAYNSADSMSGILGLTRDLEVKGETLDVFAERVESGGHRASVIAVEEGRADVAAIDCRSWDLAQRFEPAARHVQVVGWTARRKGLPFITARTTPSDIVRVVQHVMASAGMFAG
jgi:ABC-type phosphate/phosphonate transport system substrate-binding protein